jgi:hypothetical protein
MQRPSKTAQRFVKAVISGAEPRACAEGVEAAGVLLAAAELHDLAAAGVLAEDGRPMPEARTWLKRQMIDEDVFAAQHRTEVTTAAGLRLNLEESPLARLASGAEPFLESHQVEAGERVRRLWERAQLQPRVTMSYSATHPASKSGPGRAADLTDLAMEARRQLSRLHDVLPADCAGVVVDVCGLLKGLQQVESERGWPRRSAKLVLRIGLDQAAQHFGLSLAAVGAESRRARIWGERPKVVG